MDQWMDRWGSQHRDISPHAGTSRPLHSTSDSFVFGNSAIDCMASTLTSCSQQIFATSGSPDSQQTSFLAWTYKNLV